MSIEGLTQGIARLRRALVSSRDLLTPLQIEMRLEKIRTYEERLVFEQKVSDSNSLDEYLQLSGD